ncbi:MAG: iron ABC transporter permease [Nitriliruptoraceae bacterium]
MATSSSESTPSPDAVVQVGAGDPVPVPPPAGRGMRDGWLSPTTPFVWVPALLVAAAMVVPLVYLLIAASSLPADRMLQILTDPATARLAGRTLRLAASVTTASVLIGVPLAWLTVRSDLPARRFFAIATALPLVIPTYVGAYALVGALAPGGLVETWSGWRPPSPYGFWGAFAALTLFTYPYVLITVQGALRGLDPQLEDAARALGHRPWSVFRRVVLPQLRPATAAGGLLVTLYVLSDFGAVSVLRYSTFTRGLYLQYRSAFDRAPAAMLGLLLVALTVVFVIAEARVAKDRGGQFSRRRSARRAQVMPLGRWKWPAAMATGTVVVAALVIPVTIIGWWLWRGLAAGESAQLALGAAGRSLLVAGLGALAAVAAAMPVAVWSARAPSRIARAVERISFTGYALPGIVVAFALVFVGIRVVPSLYQTLAMLVFAYVVLFLPQAIGAIRSSLLQVEADVEAAARTLGAGRLATLRKVTLPLATRGAIAGGALVFLTVMKELPATLLLAPTGFDTLAVRVWSATDEAFFTRAALPAMMLIILGSVPLALTMIRGRRSAG